MRIHANYLPQNGTHFGVLKMTHLIQRTGPDLGGFWGSKRVGAGMGPDSGWVWGDRGGGMVDQ